MAYSLIGFRRLDSKRRDGRMTMDVLVLALLVTGVALHVAPWVPVARRLALDQVSAELNSSNIKGKNLWMPLRYAITLEAQGPDLKLIVDLFGREKCMRLALSAYEL